MKFAFSSLACPSCTVDEVISKAKQYHYEGIELRTLENTINIFDLDVFNPIHIYETYQKFYQSGLHIPVIGTSVSFAAPDSENKKTQLENIKKFSILAQGLHCPYLRVFGGTIPEGQTYEQVLSRDIDGYREAAEIAGSYGVKLLLETHDDFSTSTAQLPLLKALDGSLGVIWDILHPYRWGEDMETTCKNLAPYIFHVHIKDSCCFSKSNFDIALPGEGAVPIPKAVSLLKEIGYDGFLCFEWEKHWHPDIPDADISLPSYINYMNHFVR